MKCPNCGAEVTGNFCEYCGSEMVKEPTVINITNNYYSDNQTQNQGQTQQQPQVVYVERTIEEQPKKKGNLVWWILGWLCIFPIPATILLYRKKMNNTAKWIIIACIWLFYILLGVSSS